MVVTLDIENSFNWIMGSPDRMEVPKYLQKIMASDFTDKVLRYDTDQGGKVYKVIERIP